MKENSKISILLKYRCNMNIISLWLWQNLPSINKNYSRVLSLYHIHYIKLFIKSMNCSSNNNNKLFSYCCSCNRLQNSSPVNQGYLKWKMREFSAVFRIRKWNMPPSGHIFKVLYYLFSLSVIISIHLVFDGNGKFMAIMLPGQTAMVSN